MLKVAISGVGGGVGQSIIKCLQRDFDIVALDGECLAAGLYAAGSAYLIPYASHPDFLENILSICQKEKCIALFPGLDIELPILSENKEDFENNGTKIIISSPEVVKICDDKLLTNAFLRENNFPALYTCTVNEAGDMKLPFIIKPKVGGARSKGVKLITRLEELKGIDENNVAQEFIDGEEFTCSGLMLDGVYYGCIVMSRTLRDGDTYKCFTVRNKAIEDLIEQIVVKLNPYGSINIQLRVRDGVPYVFEINARCSGTTAARAISGFNEPKMILDYLSKGKKPTFKIRETCILRYWKELVVPSYTLRKFKNKKHINGLDPLIL